MKKRVFFIFVFCCVFSFATANPFILQKKWVSCGKGVILEDPYYQDNETFTWTGQSKNGKADGYGVATKFVNGVFHSKYEGYYKNGIRDGKGKFTHNDGSVKTGTFVNGQLVGNGTMTTEDGDEYNGSFVNYRMHGKGILTFGNGTKFEGYMVTDFPYTGKFTYYDGKIIYIEKGQVINHKPKDVHTGYKPVIGKRVIEYFDDEWNRCQPKNAAYYRHITYSAPNIPQGVVKDYYITGEIQSVQYPAFIDYDDEGKTFLEGEQVFYYKNGTVSDKRYYYNNQLNGTSESYYPDGKIKLRENYDLGERNGDVIGYDESGKPNLIAKYEDGELHNNKYLTLKDRQAYLVYKENFERNKEAWEYKGQNGTVQVTSEDEISLQASPGRSVSGGIETGFSPKSDNIIGIQTRQRNPGKGQVLLLFGFKDWDNYCAASVGGNQYHLIYIKNGVVVEGKEAKYSSAIKPDINTIQIVNINDNITLYINGVAVEKTGRIYFDGSVCGVCLVNQSEEPIIMDAANLSVYELINPDNIPQEYLPDDTNANGNQWKGNGTGFFVDERGYIATNYHVVDGAKAMQVTLTRNGKSESYPATVVLSDKQNDLSIIKINAPSFKPMATIPYGLCTRLKETGSDVFTLGYPMADVMGSEIKFTDGKISSRSGIQGDVTVYQITVPIQPGNSGGPLFDDNGNIVGISSATLNRDYFRSENVNYAVKSSYLKNLIDTCPVGLSIRDVRKIPTSSSQEKLTERIAKYKDYVVLINVK